MVELEVSPGRVYPSSGGGARARPRKGAESCHFASNSQHANPQRRKAIYYSAEQWINRAHSPPAHLLARGDYFLFRKETSRGRFGISNFL